MLFSSFWKRGPGPPLWGPGGVLGPLDPPGSAPARNPYIKSLVSNTCNLDLRPRNLRLNHQKIVIFKQKGWISRSKVFTSNKIVLRFGVLDANAQVLK